MQILRKPTLSFGEMFLAQPVVLLLAPLWLMQSVTVVFRQSLERSAHVLRCRVPRQFEAPVILIPVVHAVPYRFCLNDGVQQHQSE